ncbi:DNA polymerase [Arthrospira platensis SPKY2]
MEEKNRNHGKHNINIYFYSHNGGKFDMKIMLKAIYTIHKETTLDLPIQISDPNHDIYQITIKYGKYNIIFRDSLKLLLSSADNLNNQLLNGEFPKLPINIKAMNDLVFNSSSNSPFTDINIELTAKLYSQDSKGNLTKDLHRFAKYDTPISYIKDYCLNDCVIIAKSLIVISESISSSIGFPIAIKDCITISSIAIYVFMRKFNRRDTPIMSIGLGSSARSFIRKAYIGGRVEVFDSGLNLDKIYHFDVPGMYALCITKELPYGNPVFVGEFAENLNSIEFLNSLHRNKLIGFFKCEVTTPNDLNIPVLGIKKDNGKLIFPLGEIVGT